VTQALAFLGVAAVVIVTPGQDTALTIRNALAGGRRSGVATAFGVAVGQATWTLAAAAGIAALLQASEPVFVALKLFGAAYLVFLGVQTWRHAREPLVDIVPGRGHRNAWTEYRRGLLTNLTNPKSAVFFGSIMATVLRPGLPVWVNVAAVAVIVVNSVWWHSLLAVVFARARVRRAYARAKHVVDRGFGAALAGLGARLAIAR
jgi:RhtB (resistance to homoserine/threonine) family protein